MAFTILSLVYYMIIAPFLFSITLWLQSKGNTAQRILSANMMLFCLIFVRSLIKRGENMDIIPQDIILSPFAFMGGTFLALALTAYPIESILPGWLRGKKILLLFSPFLTICLIYVICLLLHVRFQPFNSMTEIFDNLYDFNVWIRFLFTIITMICGAFIFIIPHFGLKMFKVPQWVKYYGYGSIGICCIYLWTTLTGSELSYLCYLIYVSLFCSIISYRALFGLIGQFKDNNSGIDTPLIKND